MGHHYSEHNHIHTPRPIKGTRLRLVVFLNIIITVSQIIGGLFSGSLSLLSDALHNGSDVMALLISYIAQRLVSKQATARQTFGYKRAEIIAAAINAVILMTIGLNLIYEATLRLLQIHARETINAEIVMVLAFFGIVINGFSMLMLQRDAQHSLNIRSAYIHLLSDALTSLAVLGAGIMMYLYKIDWIDSIISIAIAIYLIYSSGNLFKQALDILMQFAPTNLDLLVIEEEIKQNPEIANIHHVHLWQINDRQVHFEGHITFKRNLALTEVGLILFQIKQQLKHRFDITHVVLQPEYNPDCGNELIKNSG